MAKKPTTQSKSQSKSSPAPTSALEKYLAFGFVGSVIASVLAILVILLSTLSNGAFVPTGLGMVPIFLMPFGVLCLIALMIASAISRNKSK